MSLRLSLALLTCLLLIASLLSTSYLFLYPVWFGCAFPSTTGSIPDGFKNTLKGHTPFNRGDNGAHLAPFRLLVLADPQLEGDSSLPKPEDALTAKLHAHWNDLRQTKSAQFLTATNRILRSVILEDIPDALWAVRKTLDLFGNDYYLAHIYRTLHWWTRPTHVTVLGDLIGSQWVSDDEFAWRGWRYWNRVLAGSSPVERAYMSMHLKEQDEQQSVILDQEVSDWSRKVINIAGNHDIGYAGDISSSRIARFERVFGELNWDLRFVYPAHLIPADYPDGLTPEIHLIILNSMLLDTPALNSTLLSKTYDYVNDLIEHRLSPVDPPHRDASFTLLLTHVPLQKVEGVCVDGPFFDYWDFTDAGGQFEHGGLKEQNHLSQQVSESGILQALFGKTGDLNAPMHGTGRRGLILNGHDHEGCDVMHYIERYESISEPSAEAMVEEHPDDGPRQDGDFGMSSDVSSLSSAGTHSLLDREESLSDAQDDSVAASATTESDAISESLSTASFTGPSTPTPTWRWKTVRTSQYPPNDPVDTDLSEGATADLNIALREVTLRSMMGSYGGNAGLLSLWFDFSTGSWDYEITMCKAGVQHIWWSIHVLDLVTLGSLLIWGIHWLYKPRNKLVTKRIRAISYVRERPKRPAAAIMSDKKQPAKQVEVEKRRVYKHVVR